MTENSPAYGELLDALKPIFVTCSSGNNAFTDVMLNKHHDGIRMNGHPEMVFNRDEARSLAIAILQMTGQVMM